MSAHTGDLGTGSRDKFRFKDSVLGSGALDLGFGSRDQGLRGLGGSMVLLATLQSFRQSDSVVSVLSLCKPV